VKPSEQAAVLRDFFDEAGMFTSEERGVVEAQTERRAFWVDDETLGGAFFVVRPHALRVSGPTPLTRKLASLLSQLGYKVDPPTETYGNHDKFNARWPQ
jgi:hypothetical protein